MSKKKKKFKLKEKHFELLIKSLIVISCSLLTLSIIISIFSNNELLINICFIIGAILFIIQALISCYYEKIARFLNKYFGTELKLEEPVLKTKIGKAYKYKFTFNTYEEFIEYINQRSKIKSYEDYKIMLDKKTTMYIYEHKGEYYQTAYLNFFIFFKVEELTEEIMKEAKIKFEEFTEGHYADSKYAFNIMFVVAVEKENEYYNKFINKYIIHEEYNSYFACGISLKEKEITIVHQKDGDGLFEYKCVEMYFPSFMNFQSKDKIQ